MSWTWSDSGFREELYFRTRQTRVNNRPFGVFTTTQNNLSSSSFFTILDRFIYERKDSIQTREGENISTPWVLGSQSPGSFQKVSITERLTTSSPNRGPGDQVASKRWRPPLYNWTSYPKEVDRQGPRVSPPRPSYVGEDHRWNLTWKKLYLLAPNRPYIPSSGKVGLLRVTVPVDGQTTLF